MLKPGEMEFGIDILGSKIHVWLLDDKGVKTGLFITPEQASKMGKKLLAAADFVSVWEEV